MRQKEKERRLAQEQTNQELKDTKALLEETNRKLEGFKARAKALETEMAGLKTRLNSLLEKAKHDDQLIALLSNEISTAECKMKSQDQTFQQDMERMNAEHERLEQEISKEKCKVGQLEAALTDKQAVIERLTQQIQNLTSQQELIPNRPKTRDDDSTPRSPASSKPSSQHDCMQSPSTSECQILSQAAEAERVRLLELLAVMNRRLDEQRCVAAQAEEAFRRERHKAARLETKVARLELEKVGTGKVPSYGNSRRMQEKEAIVEELNSRIELMEEEILALRTRVHCIQQEKQDDLRTYTSLLEQARSAFLKAQRSQTSIKKNKTISL
ncbi:coiled-coil domain-containing protein 13 isoform X2 [Anabrus simplex]